MDTLGKLGRLEAADDALVAFTKTLPGYYDEDEIRTNLTIVRSLPWGAHIVELGVQYGRSASIYFQEFQRRAQLDAGRDEPNFFITLVDVWCINESDARPHFDRLVRQLGMEGLFEALWMRTDAAADRITRPIDLLHVDADHGDGVYADCRLYLPKLAPGGWALFHDYGRIGEHGEEFPAVREAVDKYTKEYGLEDHGVVNTLAIRRR